MLGYQGLFLMYIGLKLMSIKCNKTCNYFDLFIMTHSIHVQTHVMFEPLAIVQYYIILGLNH